MEAIIQMKFLSLTGSFEFSVSLMGSCAGLSEIAGDVSLVSAAGFFVSVSDFSDEVAAVACSSSC